VQIPLVPLYGHPAHVYLAGWEPLLERPEASSEPLCGEEQGGGDGRSATTGMAARLPAPLLEIWSERIARLGSDTSTFMGRSPGAGCAVIRGGDRSMCQFVEQTDLGQNKETREALSAGTPIWLVLDHG